MIPCSYAYKYTRRIRQGVSLITVGVGSWLAASAGHDEDANMNFLKALGGAALIQMGWLLHPGSIGDPQVQEEKQRSLVGGMWEDALGREEALLADDAVWTLARVLGTGAVALQGYVWNENPKMLINWGSSGGSLIGYVSDRAWGHFRVHRAHPFGGTQADAAAWLVNFAVGNLLDMSGAMMGLGMKYAFNQAIQGPGKVEPYTSNDIANALVPMLIGTFVNQLMTAAVSHTSGAGSPGGRMFGHVMRLAARSGARVWLGAPMHHELLPFLNDGVAAFTMHRWTSSTANAFMGGLRMPGDVVFGNSRLQRGPSRLELVIHVGAGSPHRERIQLTDAGGVPAYIEPPVIFHGAGGGRGPARPEVKYGPQGSSTSSSATPPARSGTNSSGSLSYGRASPVSQSPNSKSSKSDSKGGSKN